MVQDPLHVGQRWVERLFEQIRQEYQAHVTIVQWDWYVVGNAYLLWCQLQDTDRRHWIPGEQHGCVSAYMEYAGDPDPVNDEIRAYIEGCIRRTYQALVHKGWSHAATA
jgi:hypothetical protein